MFDLLSIAEQQGLASVHSRGSEQFILTSAFQQKPWGCFAAKTDPIGCSRSTAVFA